MQNKIIIKVLAISGVALLLIAFLFDYECIFKSNFNIPCLSCGLTRGFKFILNGELVSATKMNMLSVPIFIIVIAFYLLYLIWLLFKKDYVFKFYNYFVKHYKFVVVILLLNWIINIIYR